jgi:putative membrane protein
MNTPSFSLSLIVAAALSAGLTACNRPGEPPAPQTDTSSTQSTDTTAGTTSGTTSTDSTMAGSSTSTTTTGTSTSPSGMLETNPPSAGGATPLDSNDRNFIMTAAESGLYEVEVAKLAASKATDAAVKSFASMLVDHHTAANDKLRQVASSRSIALPTTIPADKQQVINKLGQASGADFDRQFVQTVGIKDHQTDIALFEKATREAKDTEVRNFAQSTLPTLRDHLSAAQKLPPAKSAGGNS